MLNAEASSFGPTGLNLEMELLLLTARVNDVREWLTDAMTQFVRASRWWILAACLLTPIAVTIVIWRPWRTSPPFGPLAPTTQLAPDPRLTYQGPFLNVGPDVKFVGDAVCAECHADIAAAYRRHPMGRSLLPIAQAVSPPEDLRHHNPFVALGREFRIERDGEQIWQNEVARDASGQKIYDRKTKVDFAVGFGNHGLSYLTNRDGFIYQLPISWYSQKNIWDLSPGWNEETVKQNRPTNVDCFFCHSNGVTPVSGTQNRYEQPIFHGYGIGCERCHGPGEKHVQSHDSGAGQDFTIVQPRKLPHALREAVCQQCHLEGESRITHRGLSPFVFRPGLPLESVMSVFVRVSRDSDQKAVNHVEQMYLSKCFGGSLHTKNPLGCIFCHDPHVPVPPAERVVHYRQSCLQCHHDQGCTVPEPQRRQTSKEDSCIDCHMPRFSASDIPHAASTNHQILRDGKNGSAAGSDQSFRIEPSRIPIRLFYKKATEAYTPQESRDRVLALGSMVGEAPQFARDFLLAVEGFIQRDPSDFELWEAKGVVLTLVHRETEALAAFTAGLAYAPQRENLVVGAATAAQFCGQLDVALRYWKQAAQINPWNVAAHANITLVALQQNDWAMVKQHAQIWLDLDPSSVKVRQAWVLYWLHENDRTRAEQEFAKIEALQPKNLGELRLWFRREMR
jgi:hypothetical protein